MLHNLIKHLEHKEGEKKIDFLKDSNSFENLQTIISDLKSFSKRKAEK